MARPQTVSFSQPLYVVALHLELATPSELRTPINPNLKAKGVKASTGLSSETNNPTAQKQVVIEPLCGWLLTLGHIFFEASSSAIALEGLDLEQDLGMLRYSFMDLGLKIFRAQRFAVLDV